MWVVMIKISVSNLKLVQEEMELAESKLLLEIVNTDRPYDQCLDFAEGGTQKEKLRSLT